MGWFVSNFVKDRRFRYRIGDIVSNQHIQENGTTQGSVISVTLFAIAINDVADDMPPNVNSALFVDDYAMWITSSTTASAQRQLQIGLDRLQRWSARTGLLFSTEKTKCVHFCRKRNECADPVLTLYGQPVNVVHETRFLGLIFDRKLTYAAHFNQLRERCFKAVNIFKVLTKMKFGADRKTLLTLYRSLVRSKLEYGCIVYESATETAKRVLDTIQNHALRIITGAFRTSPTSSLMVDADEMPLSLRRRFLSMKYAIKIRQFPGHPAYAKLFSETLQHRAGTLPASARHPGLRVCEWLSEADIDLNLIETYHPPSVEPWALPEFKTDTRLLEITKDLPPDAIQQVFLQHLHDFYPDHVVFYTDGSKCENGTGCAFVRDASENAFALPAIASVFTAELYALFRCMDHILSSRTRRHVIFSDSLSSIQALSAFETHPTSSHILELIRRRMYRAHCRGKSVTIAWVPSHVGISGNERADRCAKSATQERVPTGIGIPFSDFYPKIREYVRDL